MKILITGANGLLGQKIVDYCLNNSITFIATSKGRNRNSVCPGSNYKEMDICDSNQITDVFSSEKPTHVIHTAAITNVDYCELNPEECQEVNVNATKQLSLACNEIKAHFQFVSTDFVFDGEKGNYVESDKVNPLSIYGQSKADAETAVQVNSKFGWSIVRTIIVYGVGENLSRSNIVCWAKGALEKGDEMNIIDDQFRSPTYADDLAAGCIGIIEHDEKGIFHVSGPKTYSIYQIVEAIAKHFNYSMDKVNKISSDTLNQPAKRPPKTGFDLSKAYAKIKYSPKTLEETLDILF